jgi:uncharacterized membrane protein
MIVSPEDVPMDELLAQFKQLENKSGAAGGAMGIPAATTVATHASTLVGSTFSKYGIYIVFFLYVLVMVIVLQPSYLYQKNEETQQQRFLWKRFFLAVVIAYVILLAAYLGLQYYIKKKI